MKKTILTDIQWKETINIPSMWKGDNGSVSFVNRPPNLCHVKYDPDTRNRIVFHNY